MPPKIINIVREKISHHSIKSKKVIIPAVIVTAVILGLILLLMMISNGNHELITASGTIETTEIHLGSEFGGRVESVNVKEGDSILTGQLLVIVHRASGTSEKVRSPIDGVVLERIIEPGEIASPGTTLLIIANIEELTLTVYIPEDRYGQLTLGQSCRVQVDSFPKQDFDATLKYIADKAEFTPRNVQTTSSRKSTVYAIRLHMEPSDGKLKPGMPADVTCEILYK